MFVAYNEPIYRQIVMKFTKGTGKGLMPPFWHFAFAPVKSVKSVRSLPSVQGRQRISVHKLSSPHSTQLLTAAAADADTIESAEKDDERGALIKLPLSAATAYVTPSCVRGNWWRQRYMRFAIF